MTPYKHAVILRISSEDPQAKRAITLHTSNRPSGKPEGAAESAFGDTSGGSEELSAALRALSEGVSRLHVAHVLEIALEVAQRVTCAAIELEPKILYALIDKHLQGLKGEALRVYAGEKAYAALKQVIDEGLQEVIASITLDQEAAPWSVRLGIPPGGRLELGPLSQVEAVRRVWFPGEGDE